MNLIAVILAAGKGTRLSSLYSCSSKCLIPINGMCVIGHKVVSLSQCKYIEKIVVIIKENEMEIPKYLGNMCNEVPIIYYYQSLNKSGLVNALYSFAGIYNCENTEIVLNLGDEYYEELNYNDFIETYYKHQASISPILVKTYEEEKIKANYTVNLKNQWDIIDAIEKPKKVFNNYIGCGTILISGKLLIEFAQNYKDNFYGLELIDWIKFAILKNLKCYGYEFKGIYVNLNTRKDLECIYDLKRKNNMLLENKDKKATRLKNKCNLDKNETEYILLGRPDSEYRVYILDDKKRILGFNNIGEIWISKKNFVIDKYITMNHCCNEVELDIINPTEKMIKLNIKGYITMDGLYYGSKIPSMKIFE